MITSVDVRDESRPPPVRVKRLQSLNARETTIDNTDICS
jgi:hypothetical protein